MHAAGGRSRCRAEPAIILHLPEEATSALKRDPTIGPLLQRQVAPDQCVVSPELLPAVRERLLRLGFHFDEAP